MKKKTKKKSFQNKMQFINFVELKQPVRRLPVIRVLARVQHARTKTIFIQTSKSILYCNFYQSLAVFLCNKIRLFYAGVN
jgi:hypothetical protein